MRVLFINTTDLQGGAAVILQRLMKDLAGRYATENRLLVKIKTSDSSDTRQVLTAAWQTYTEKVIDKLTKTAGLLYQSFPFSARKIQKEIEAFQPDLIHLHNTHGSYFPTPLIQTLSNYAPIIWTLHDMWSFTGNAAHTFGNMSWKELKNDRALTHIPPTIGVNNGAWLLRQKQRLYNQTNLTVVCPSTWLQELAKQSPVFEGKQVARIYNGVNTDIFSPKDKQAAKQKLGLPTHRKTVMFSAAFLGRSNPWKGGTDLEEILRQIDAQATEKINFLAIGHGRMDNAENLTNLEIIYKDYVKGEGNMSDCFAASELFIYPTRADNLSNSLVESIACGVPPITFAIGGNQDIVTNDYNGVILPTFDFTAFAHHTLDLLQDDDKRRTFAKNCRTRALDRFALEEMTDQYYHLYQSIISTHTIVKQ